MRRRELRAKQNGGRRWAEEFFPIVPAQQTKVALISCSGETCRSSNPMRTALSIRVPATVTRKIIGDDLAAQRIKTEELPADYGYPEPDRSVYDHDCHDRLYVSDRGRH